ncbi:MAG: hypothetical protein ACK40G_01655 [Cytophagaceae bacterium]
MSLKNKKAQEKRSVTPKNRDQINYAQRPSTNTRGDIESKTPEHINPNNGPMQRSRKKSF